MREPTEAQFLKDIAGHKMTVLRDDGIYRHIQFKANSSNMWFDLVTWPGVLTINGDMGTWTFSRVEDMFTFFRSSKELYINLDYWAEKLRHGNFGGRDGAKVWDAESFMNNLLRQLKEHHGFKGKKLKEITQAVKEEIFIHEGEGPYAMPLAAYEFTYEFEADRDNRSYTEKLRCPRQVPKFQFDGTDLPTGMVYSYHFIWCLYAIVWGIQQYDTSKVAVAA